MHSDAREPLVLMTDAAYWLVHHDVTGVCQTSGRAAGRMVAAGMLAELVDFSTISVNRDRVSLLTPARGRQRPGLDSLGVAVLGQIAAAPGLAPLEVIDGLAPSIRKRVAQRLIDAGRADRRRIRLFEQVAVAKAGDTAPAWVRGNLANKVDRGMALTAQECFLLRLVQFSSMTGNPFTEACSQNVGHALWQMGQIDRRYTDLLETATAALLSTAVAR